MPIIPKERSKTAEIPAKAEKEKPKGDNTIEFEIRKPKYAFSDIVLAEKMKNEILDAMSSFQFRDKLFDEWNLSSVIKRPVNLCINFYGKAGTGKTMAANAVANYLGFDIIQVEYSEIESKYVGETSKNLTKLFREAQEKNAVIVFDEADALLSKRVPDMQTSNDVSVNQTRNVLLTLMDDYKGIVVFTTNLIENFDSAFMRRIPYHIYFDFPNEEVRTSLLNFYLTNTVPHDIDISSIASKHNGITGADISNALVSSALKTARASKDRLSHEDFEEAVVNIIESKKANQKQSGVTVETKKITKEEAMEGINRQKSEEN